MNKDDTSNQPTPPTAPKATPPRMPGALAMIMEIFGVSRGVTIGSVLFVTLVLGVAVVYFIRSTPPTTITITSGPKDSIFHRYAERYSEILARHGVTVHTLDSDGSEDNLRRLANSAFNVDVGFVQSGVADTGTQSLVSLGSVAHQPLMVFYHGAPMELLSGLAGKRVVIGARGSGTQKLVSTLLAANGIKPGGPTTLLEMEPSESSDALLKGTVDAVFLMGEDASLAIIRQLLLAPDIHLFSFTQSTAYVRHFSYLTELELPEGFTDLGRNIPSHDVRLIGPTIELVARKTLNSALSELLLEAAREVHGKASLFQHKGEFPAPIEHEFPISNDAASFYKSGRTFLYRYLPFWLASIVSRILVSFVPAIVVLIPVLRSIPPMYRWRIRTRIFRWYRALLALERELRRDSSPEKREHLLNRLEAIDKEVNAKKFPAFFADQLYALRGNINFVRHQIETKTAK